MTIVHRFSVKKLIPLFIAVTVASVVLGIRFWGLLQLLELHTYDQLLRMRLPFEAPDERIVIIGTDEGDLATLGAGFISDRVMADLIRRVAQNNPRVIGLDYYRDLPLGEGFEQLAKVLAETPNVIGIEKQIGNERARSIPGHPTLSERGRVAASDLLTDVDGRIRRVFLYPAVNVPTYRHLPSLGLRVAKEYLAKEGHVKQNLGSPNLEFNGVKFPHVVPDTGGYVRAEAGGYQILLNLRNTNPKNQPFAYLKLTDVLREDANLAWLADRIVMIGSTAVSDADMYLMSYGYSTANQGKMFGVEVHSTLASQIISAVLDGRHAVIYTWPEWFECAVCLAFAVSVITIYRPNHSLWLKMVIVALFAVVTLAISYFLMILAAIWFPCIPVMLSVLGTTFVIDFYSTYQFKLLSNRDELTRLGNRRLFNEALQREWRNCLQMRQPLSLVICDVDYFKRYNDTYGHPQGDECLRQVAKALKSVVKRPQDVLARYGGEEFVLLMPNTDVKTALDYAELIRQRVKDLQLEHQASSVSAYVSLSMGLAVLIPTASQLPHILLQTADAALYEAKQKGRDQVVVKFPKPLSDIF